MIEDYFDKIHNSESGAPYKYAESFNRYQIQLPLGITWPVTTGSLSSDNLYDDRTDNWLFYEAGLHKTAIYSDVSERFGGLTVTVYSGSTNVYVQLSEYLADTNPAFISAPYTVSGENQNNDLLLASYSADTPENPEAYWISLPEPGTYKISFPFPVVANAITVTHSGSSAYALSQMLPRKTVQAFDLEVGSIKAYHVSASLIDTIALQVSDSIVVGPELIGAKSIDGSKIVDGTISGVLIRDGTIFANKIAAGTITATQIAVSGITADNLAARVITAEKIVLSGITAELLGAEAVTAAALASGAVVSGKLADDSVYASNIVGGQITAYHVAANTITGDRIQANTISGELITAGTITSTNIAVSGITADRLNVAQLDAVAAKMGTLVVNSGVTVGTNGYITVPSGYISAGKARLDSTGIKIGDVADSNLPSITDTLRIAGSGGGGNIVGMALYNGAFHATNPQAVLQLDGTTALEIENNALNGITNFNFPASGVENSAAVNIYNANLQLRRTPNPPEPNITPGALIGFDSDDTVRYKLGPDRLLLNNNTADTFTVDASNGNINTLGRIHASGNLHVGPGDHVFTVNGTTGTLHVGPPPHVFRVNGASGDTHIAGTLDVVGNTRVEGNLLIGAAPAVAQIVNTTGDISTNGNITSLNNVYGRTVTATTDLYGEDTLNVANDGAGDYRFKVSSTGKLTSDAMGYITVRRTATLAITTAGTTIVWDTSNGIVRSKNISVSTDTITIDNAGYYMFSATFATVANLTSLRMSLTRGTVNYVSTLHGAGLSTGGGYIFNFNIGFWASAGSTYKVTLTPSSNTTLNVSNEAFAAPSPIMNIFQAIGV